MEKTVGPSTGTKVDSNWIQSFFRFMHGLGFRFPKFHGISVILLCCVLLSISLVITRINDPIGLLLSLIFLLVFYFSSESIIDVFRKTKSTPPIPLLSLAVVCLSLAFYLGPKEAAISFGVLTLFSLPWLLSLLFSKWRHSTKILVTGSISLAGVIPITMLSSIDVVSNMTIIESIAIAWMFACVTMQLVLQVESLRKRISPYLPVLTWGFVLISTLPIILFGILPVFVCLSLIEPSYQVLSQAIRKSHLRSIYASFKDLGIRLTISLFLFIVLFTTGFYIPFRIELL